MPVRESYAEGAPSWVDLSTADVEGAIAFYSALFGWNWEQNETGEPGSCYYVASLNGHAAAGLHHQHQEQVDMGVLPTWNLHLNVAEVDATMRKVEANGGSVLAPAFDVMDAGRLGVAAEPSGAVVCFWQAGAHIGAGVVDEPGAYCWADLVTPDPKGAVEFFTEVVGMGHGTREMPGLGSVDFLKVGDDDVAAIVLPPTEGISPHWQINFTVADCDATSAQIKELGGAIIVEPFDIPPGRLAVATDPSGGEFAIIGLAEMH